MTYKAIIEISPMQLNSLWNVVCHFLDDELRDYKELPEDEQDGSHIWFDLLRIRTIAKRADQAFKQQGVKP